MNEYRDKYERILSMCAHSLQGCYGRFYYEYYLPSDEDTKDCFCERLNDAHIDTMMDFIMYMEG